MLFLNLLTDGRLLSESLLKLVWSIMSDVLGIMLILGDLNNNFFGGRGWCSGMVTDHCLI